MIHLKMFNTHYFSAQVPIMTTPMQETDRCSQEGLQIPTASPCHVVPIPVEHIPDTPVSQKSGKHHKDTHSESNSSTSRKSRSRSSMERELKALKASSPYGAKRELVLNWTKSGYYRSPGAGTVLLSLQDNMAVKCKPP